MMIIKGWPSFKMIIDFVGFAVPTFYALMALMSLLFANLAAIDKAEIFSCAVFATFMLSTLFTINVYKRSNLIPKKDLIAGNVVVFKKKNNKILNIDNDDKCFTNKFNNSFFFISNKILKLININNNNDDYFTNKFNNSFFFINNKDVDTNVFIRCREGHTNRISLKVDLLVKDVNLFIKNHNLNVTKKIEVKANLKLKDMLNVDNAKSIAKELNKIVVDEFEKIGVSASNLRVGGVFKQKELEDSSIINCDEIDEDAVFFKTNRKISLNLTNNASNK